MYFQPEDLIHQLEEAHSPHMCHQWQHQVCVQPWNSLSFMTYTLISLIWVIFYAISFYFKTIIATTLVMVYPIYVFYPKLCSWKALFYWIWIIITQVILPPVRCFSSHLMTKNVCFNFPDYISVISTSKGIVFNHVTLSTSTATLKFWFEWCFLANL